VTLPRPTRDWTVTPAAVSFTAQGTITATNTRAMRLIMDAGVTRGSWTDDYSCDSVTAGTKGDGVNRIVADANWVGNTPGNAHSWRVTTLHGGMGQVCFDRDATGDRFGSIYHSPAAGFTGGTTTARPTATDEVEVTQSSSWLDGAANGNISVDWWICTTSLQEGTIITVRSSGSPGGPVAMFVAMRPTTKIASLLSNPPPFVRWQCNGSGGSAGDFSTWAWQTRVSGTNRTMSLTCVTPLAALDVDSNRVLETTGSSNATINTVGWLDDFLVVASAVTDNTTYSDEDGTLAWIIVDSLVLPWDRTTVRTSNSAAAVLNVRYTPAPADAEAPVITILTDPNIQPDEDMVFTVTDIDPGIRALYIGITRFSLGVNPGREWVYDAGFLSPWRGTIDVIANGYQVRITRPASGWVGRVRLHVRVIDASGNLE
jgi:hypothetical protein